MVLGPIFLLIAGLITTHTLFYYAHRPCDERRKRMAFLALGLALAYAGTYMYFAAWCYKDLMKSFPNLYVTKFEPDYFAIQTMTTVGYGIDLCEHIKTDPNIGELPHSELCALHEIFHKRASFLMLAWAFGWVAVVRASIEYVKRVLDPDKRE